MRHEWHEWDWPAERPPTHQRRKYYVEYQPSGWSSPRVRKAVDIYWRTIIGLVKAVIAVPLALIAIGAFYLLWIIIGLVV
jgi:hypothetical protein